LIKKSALSKHAIAAAMDLCMQLVEMMHVGAFSKLISLYFEQEKAQLAS
jgi:hypothetical protein